MAISQIWTKTIIRLLGETGTECVQQWNIFWLILWNVCCQGILSVSAWVTLPYWALLNRCLYQSFFQGKGIVTNCVVEEFSPLDWIADELLMMNITVLSERTQLWICKQRFFLRTCNPTLVKTCISPEDKSLPVLVRWPWGWSCPHWKQFHHLFQFHIELLHWLGCVSSVVDFQNQKDNSCKIWTSTWLLLLKGKVGFSDNFDRT